MTSPGGATPGRALRDRVLDVLDPNGEVRRLVAAVDAAAGHLAVRALLKIRGIDLDAWREQRRQFEHPVDIATNTMGFAALGWSPSSQLNVEAYATALDLLGQGRSEDAEGVLTDSWDSEMLLRRAVR